MLSVNFDLQLKNRYKKKILIGVDEAGRGPLAGPVVAVSCFVKNFSLSFLELINDSKKLSPTLRESVFEKILHCNDIVFSFAYATHTEIDTHNILNASLLAMKRAVENIVKKNFIPRDDIIVVVDGNKMIKGISYQQICVVKGDEKSLSVGCASIIAKVLRDRWMDYYDSIYPQYGFKKHKGYPTRYHIEMIKKYGISPIHRKSFKVLFE